MNRKKIVSILFGLILCLISAVTILTVGVYSWIDPQNIQSQLGRALEKQTGRKAQVGHLTLHLFPWPEIKVSHITLSNMASGKAANLIEADHLVARLNIGALFHKRIYFHKLQFSDVRIHLEENEKREKNWEFTPLKSFPDQTALKRLEKAEIRDNSKWGFNFDSISFAQVECWYDNEYRHRHANFHLESIDIHKTADDRIRFNILGNHHQADFRIAGRLNHAGDLLLNEKLAGNFPIRFQIDLSELLQGQEVGNLHLIGSFKDFLKKRGYSISMRGTLLDLKDLNLIFPNADLPSIKNLTLNSVIEDAALDTENKAKPRIRLLQLQTKEMQPVLLQAYHSTLFLNHINIVANQLNENINTQITGKLNDTDFHWAGDFGTLSHFQNLLFNQAQESIPVKGSIASDRYSLQLHGTIGGKNPALTVRYNLLNFQDNFYNIGQIKAKNIVYNGKVFLPFQLHPHSVNSFKNNLMDHIRMEGNVNAADFSINHYDFKKLATFFIWKDHVLTLNSLQMDQDANHVKADLVYDFSHADPIFRMNLHPSVIPMRWIETQFNIKNLYEGPVEVVGYLSGSGNNKDIWKRNLNGHLGIAGTGGTLSEDGIRFFLGKAANEMPIKKNLSTECLAIHTVIDKDKLYFDEFTIQAKKFALTGQGFYWIPDRRLDFHLMPDITLGIIEVSMPITIQGNLAKPVIYFEKVKNKGFVLNINGLKNMQAKPDYCGPALLKAKEIKN